MIENSIEKENDFNILYNKEKLNFYILKNFILIVLYILYVYVGMCSLHINTVIVIDNFRIINSLKYEKTKEP